jgi:hypothetical protein
VVVLWALGDAVRLGLEVPPELRCWYRAASIERLDAVVREASETARSLTLPSEPGRLLADEYGFDVVLRDRLESARVGVFLALIERGAPPCDVSGFVALCEALQRFDHELAQVAGRAEVARALGQRAGMVSSSWWGLQVPR